MGPAKLCAGHVHSGLGTEGHASVGCGRSRLRGRGALSSVAGSNQLPLLIRPTSPTRHLHLQVLGQAFGGKTFKLKFGHHGGNHPIRYTPTGERPHPTLPGVNQSGGKVPCVQWPVSWFLGAVLPQERLSRTQ